MEQLIFVGVILLFSILEAVGRKQKQRRKEEEEGMVLLPEEWEEAEEGLAQVGDEPATWLPTQPVPTSQRRDPSTSEGLIPVDVWEEIQSLARGDRAPTPSPAPPVPRPARPTPVPEEPTRLPVRSRARVPDRAVAKRPAHMVHSLHPNMGKPMAQRLSPLDKPHVAPGASRDVSAVRAMLTGGASGMRQAVILHEVLGPPAAVRGDPFESEA